MGRGRDWERALAEQQAQTPWAPELQEKIEAGEPERARESRTKFRERQLFRGASGKDGILEMGMVENLEGGRREGEKEGEGEHFPQAMAI